MNRVQPPEWLLVFADMLEVALRAWGFMLLLGGLHHDVTPDAPALGYLMCFTIMAFTYVILDKLRTPKKAGEQQ